MPISEAVRKLFKREELCLHVEISAPYPKTVRENVRFTCVPSGAKFLTNNEVLLKPWLREPLQQAREFFEQQAGDE